MSDASAPPPVTRRPRLLWTLLGAMILVGLLPLVVSHYFLIGINKDSLETLEKKYLTRSAVSIAGDLENLVSNNRQQLQQIAAALRTMRSALPAGTDAFQYAAETKWIADYVTPDGDLVALRAINTTGQGAEAIPAGLDAAVLKEMELARDVALAGRDSTGRIINVESLNQPAIVMGVPVKDGTSTIGAVVGVVGLRRIVDRVRDEGKGDVTAFLVDRDGRVLLHSEPAVDVQHPDFSNLKIVKDFAKAGIPARLTESYTDSDNTKLLGTVAPTVANTAVIVQKPESHAFASVDQMVKRTVQWVAIALALAIIVAILFASNISRPIRMLAARSYEIAQGNYQ